MIATAEFDRANAAETGVPQSWTGRDDLVWHTPLPGAEPLITTYCRLAFGYVPEAFAGYTRALTVLWAALLATFALIDVALVVFGLARAWLVPCTLVNLAIMLAAWTG